MPINLTRSILAILLPGGLAVTPWLLMVVLGWSELGTFYEKYTILVNVTLLGVMIILGKFFEAYGAMIEVRWDADLEPELNVEENWYIYLQRKIDPEPVGYRYLSKMVTSLYFELTMAFAIMFFFVGTVVIFTMTESELRGFAILGAIYLGVAMPDFFIKQAKLSHKRLCETRKEMNERLDAA